MMSGNLSAQWQSFGNVQSCNDSGSSFAPVASSVGSYSWLVMSSMVGPMEVVLGIQSAKDNPTNRGSNSIYIC